MSAPLHARRSWRLLALPLALAAFAAFAACGGDDDATAGADKPTVEVGGTTVPATATKLAEGAPTASATGSATAGTGAARRTSDAKINTVLDAIEKKDAAALAALALPLTTPCTTVAGAGGPPKCDGVANGTPVTKFPALTCELSFLGTDQIQSYFASGPLGAANVRVYAVASVKDPGLLPYNPQGDYVVVIETSAATGPSTGSMFNVNKDGKVVNYWSGCGASPAQIMGAQGGTTVLLAPAG